jgi:16S rRNA (cytidine1402-2'-O)-methyltransferase
MGNTGNLFLIPTIIAANTHDAVVPPEVKRRLIDIRHFLAEDIRTARRYLSSLEIYQSVEALTFFVLDKNTQENELGSLFAPLFEGNHLGVLSESGCPGIADPGAIAVRFAHRHGIKVIPMVGPSSVFLSLMASGLNGQHFAFQGYLPIQSGPAAKVIRELEKESRSKNQTQIFIETPYRNNALLANLLKHLAPDTSLCLAVDVTGANEFILTQSVKEWRRKTPTLPKNPAVFLFLA